MDSRCNKILEGMCFGSKCKYRYNVRDCVGRGAKGNVYKATVLVPDINTGKSDLVVKLVHDMKPRTWSDYWAKLEMLVGLRHKNLVLYHKVTVLRAENGSSVEVLMDYCRGGDLKALLENLIEKKSVLDQREAVRFAKDIAEGLSYMHDKNIIHGDLKPGNVFVCEGDNGGKKLVIGDLDDFVQMQGDRTCSNDVSQLCGTYRYMSPEMIKKFVSVWIPGLGDSPGRKTDIWSLGCIILVLVHFTLGRTDFWLTHKKGEKVQVGELSEPIMIFGYFKKVVNGYFPLVDKVIPKELRSCIKRCLRVKTDERSSAAEAVNELTIILNKIVPADHSYNETKEQAVSAVSVTNQRRKSDKEFSASIQMDPDVTRKTTCGSTCGRTSDARFCIGKGMFSIVCAAMSTNHDSFYGEAKVAPVSKTHFDLALRNQPRQYSITLLRLNNDPVHAAAYQNTTIARNLTGASLSLTMEFYDGDVLSSQLRVLANNPTLLHKTLRNTSDMIKGLMLLCYKKVNPGDIIPCNVLLNQTAYAENQLAINRGNTAVSLPLYYPPSCGAIHFEGAGVCDRVPYLQRKLPYRNTPYSPEEYPGWKKDIYDDKVGKSLVATIGDLDDIKTAHGLFSRSGDVMDLHPAARHESSGMRKMCASLDGDSSSGPRASVENPPLQYEKTWHMPTGLTTDTWSMSRAVLELLATADEDRDREWLQKYRHKVERVDDTFDSFCGTFVPDGQVTVTAGFVSDFKRNDPKRCLRSSSSQMKLTTGIDHRSKVPYCDPPTVESYFPSLEDSPGKLTFVVSLHFTLISSPHFCRFLMGMITIYRARWFTFCSQAGITAAR